MGEAREILDRVTEAVFKGDSEALKALYAPNAVAETPDQGTISGRDQILHIHLQGCGGIENARPIDMQRQLVGPREVCDLLDIGQR